MVQGLAPALYLYTKSGGFVALKMQQFIVCVQIKTKNICLHKIAVIFLWISTTSREHFERTLYSMPKVSCTTICPMSAVCEKIGYITQKIHLKGIYKSVKKWYTVIVNMDKLSVQLIICSFGGECSEGSLSAGRKISRKDWFKTWPEK